MSTQTDDQRKKSYEEYERAFLEINALLTSASLEFKNKSLSHENVSKTFEQIKAAGSNASAVIGAVIGYIKYKEFFLASYEFMKPYLDELLQDSLWGTKKSILELLPEYGEQSYELLYRVFSKDKDNDRRHEAAIGLIRIGGKGIEAIVNAINSEATTDQELAINAIGKALLIATPLGFLMQIELI